jgi:Co/Zn/Cd efflux system component
MSAGCCTNPYDPHRGNENYRRVLWVVLAINALMFTVEVVAGLAAGSASLQADALDFLGDAGNYAISLFVVGMALRYRAIAAHGLLEAQCSGTAERVALLPRQREID